MDAQTKISLMTQEAKEALFVYGLVDELHRNGLIEPTSGTGTPLTDEGREVIAALRESGFTVPHDKVKEIMNALNIKIQPLEVKP